LVLLCFLSKRFCFVILNTLARECDRAPYGRAEARDRT
jgi:hypothetical protein